MNFIKKFLLSIIVILTLILIIMFGLKSNPLISHYDMVGYDFITSLQYYVFEKPAKNVADFFSSFANYEDTTRELELLQEYIDNISVMNELYKEVKEENEELKSLLNMKNSTTDFNVQTANVIARDEDGWNNYITIDLGKEDGVALDQAVVTSKGLIGKIYMLFDTKSVVKLITSEDGLSKVAVKINMDDNDEEAILEYYDANSGYLVVRVLDNNTEIEVGSSVTTSAIGGVYPNGILVGSVESVDSANYLLGKIVYVKPSADFKNFTKVNVIERLADLGELSEESKNSEDPVATKGDTQHD